MILHLPNPPSNNVYYRHVGHKTLLSTEGRGYRLAVLEKRPRIGWPMLGPLRVLIDVFNGRQDLDNVPKAILDSLQHAKIFENDRQVQDLRIVRQRPKPGPAHVIVTIEEIRSDSASQAPQRAEESTTVEEAHGRAEALG